ncbi:MAG: sporulation protein [Syntrophomonadaceae bacterium]|nr:sporulation protein [Syntrophomonadaceae bacterium]
MFKENIETIASKLENLVSTKTMVGTPIVSGNVTIIPILSAAFGFGSGVGEGGEKSGHHHGKGTGGGGGAKVDPIAMVVIQDGEVKVYSLGKGGTLEKLAELIPTVLGSVQKECECRPI